jgi:metal-responsive CopG/Arc/MetJ family transcriptional regulator
MKVNITLDDELLERVDEYADKTYISRSGLISLAVTQYLNTNEMILAVKDMAVSMRKIADMGKVDEKTMEELKDFERLSNMLVEGIK